MTTIVDTFIIIAWGLFWVYWIAAAIKSRHGAVTSRTQRGIFMRLLILFILILTIRRLPEHWDTVHHSPLLLVLGLIMFVSGLALAVWARIYLGSNWGFPTAQQKNTELVTSGPYKLVRHPIYTGILTAMLGTAIAVSLFWLAIFISAGVYFIWCAFDEEKYLVKSFPNQYTKYVKHSKMLIPYIF